MTKTKIIRAGVDVGATLSKLVIEEVSGKETYSFFPSKEIESLIPILNNAEEVGITGGGVTMIAQHTDVPFNQINEFGAWSAGANVLLGNQEVKSYLLVSLGTGTSAMLINNQDVNRVGGTALGGGTLLGLAAALLNVYDFSELCQLADEGKRYNVDLQVADIYAEGNISLEGDLTAASFAKLARQPGEKASSEDLAAAIMALVGENVALICGGLATQHNVSKVVYGGATLRNNPALARVLISVTRMLGKDPHILNDGEFAGAIGALKLMQLPL